MAGTTASEVKAQSISITSTNPSSLSEANLNGATMIIGSSSRVGLNDTPSSYTFTGLSGLSTRGVTLGGGVGTATTLTLNYDNTEFDTDATLSLTVRTSGGDNLTTTNTVTVTAIVESTPGQVMGVRLTSGIQQLQVAWTALTGTATYNTRYKVQWKSGTQIYDSSRQATVTTNSYTITNLTPGLEHTVRVIATDPKAPTADGTPSDEVMALTGGAATGNTDYDQDDNNLTEIRTLAQLDAIRYDLNGDGTPTVSQQHAYNSAFIGRRPGMGCPATCIGYELMNDLDFDENGNGERDDSYNQGAGWNPIGVNSNRFTATFQGNGHVIANLFINRSTTDISLFGYSTGVLSQLGLVNVEITGRNNTGGLVGHNRGTVSTSYVTGQVTGNNFVGGLVGYNNQGTITASYATGQVTGSSTAVGGLVGFNFLRPITASYATGRVTVTGSSTAVGGLIGDRAGGTLTASYYDRETSGQSDTGKGEPKTTAELQTPTDYTGIYENWNVNVDGVTGNDNPWAFGEDDQYPVLRHGRDQAQINAQFFLQIPEGDLRMLADVNQDLRIDAQDALLMYRTYLPGVQGAGVTETEQVRANAWQRQGRAVGGDLNGDGRITEQDALIMYYAYQFRALLQNHAALRQLLFNGLRGNGSQQMPPTDTTYREFLRRALRLR